MKPLTRLSQRDVKWRNDKLGYGDTNIGDYGCLITAIAMIGRIDDVREVNNILKENNGYVGVNQNLVVWVGVSSIPSLTFNYRYYSYENEKVKEIISKQGGCIVEVDGTPIGGSRHWLVYIGNSQLLDPWTGTTRPTSSYTAISFVDISYNEIEEDVEKPCEDVEKWKTLFGVSSYEEAVEWKEREMGFLEDERAKVKFLESKNDTLEIQIMSAKSVIDSLSKRNDELSYQVELIRTNLKHEEDKVESLSSKVMNLTEEITRLNTKIQDWSKNYIDSVSLWEFIKNKWFV